MKTTEILQLFAGEEAAAENGAAAETAAEETVETETVETETVENNGCEAEKEPEGAPGGEKQRQETDRKSGAELLRAVKISFEEREKEKRIAGVIEAWEREAEELKETYPGFDLASEMKNGEIGRLLCAGVPLRRAYETVNLEKIIGSAMRFASLNAGKKAAGALLQHRSRPQENGVLDRASSVKRTDVRSLTEKDILRILDEVSKGAKIKF